jgi:broad specificity phosphatase PhoE
VRVLLKSKGAWRPDRAAPLRATLVAMSVRRIFLARHGNRQDFVDPEWVDGADERYDPPLSVDGFEQARRLGQRLAGEGIAAIVVSPFLRTVQTAEQVNATLGVPVFLEPGFGEWLSRDSFERMPRLSALEREAPPYPLLGAGAALAWPETSDQMRARVRHTLERLIEHLDGTLLVVTHAASAAAAVLVDPRIARVECPLCALFCLERDADGWRLVLDAEVTHVGARLGTFAFPI